MQTRRNFEDGRYERWFGKSLGGTIQTFTVYNKKTVFRPEIYTWHELGKPDCNVTPEKCVHDVPW